MKILRYHLSFRGIGVKPVNPPDIGIVARTTEPRLIARQHFPADGFIFNDLCRSVLLREEK